MGFEEGAAQLAVGMLFRGEYSPDLPQDADPKRPGIEGTPNHIAWALGNQWAWAIEKGTSDQRQQTAAAVKRFLGRQLTSGFQCVGKACEQMPPSHQQQWTNPVAVMLETARRRGQAEVLELSVQWFLSLFALAEPFVVDDPSFKFGWRVFSPGARAFRAKQEPGKPLVGGTSFMVDRLMAWRHGQPLDPGNNPSKEIDELALYLFDALPADLQERLRTGVAPVPPLRWPILYKRRGPEFVAWLPEVDASGVQCVAGWVGGAPVWGFDGALEPDLPGSAEVSIRGGEMAADLLRLGVDRPAPAPLPPPEPLPPQPGPVVPAPARRTPREIAADLRALAAEVEALGLGRAG